MSAPSSITTEVVNYTIANLPALALVPGTNVFAGHMIPEPDNVTMFFDAGGQAQDEYLDTMYANIEVWTRDRDSGLGYDRLQQIFEVLHRQGNVQMGRYYVYFLHATSNIMDMDRDQMERKMYKMTFRAIYRDTNMLS